MNAFSSQTSNLSLRFSSSRTLTFFSIAHAPPRCCKKSVLPLKSQVKLWQVIFFKYYIQSKHLTKKVFVSPQDIYVSNYKRQKITFQVFYLDSSLGDKSTFSEKACSRPSFNDNSCLIWFTYKYTIHVSQTQWK